MTNDIKIGIIGLGYVGLPLARVFAAKYEIVGFDINEERVEELRGGHDITNEVDDVRNTKAIDVINSIRDFRLEVQVYNPWANKEEFKVKYNLDLINKLDSNRYDGVFHVVPHKEFS